MVEVRSSLLVGAAALAAVAGLLVGAPANAAGDDEVPVAGTFAYSAAQREGRASVKGAVHAVRRVPGGTVVYYSLGFPRDQKADWTGIMPTSGLSTSYGYHDAWSLALVDTTNLQLYRPLGDPGCLCSDQFDFKGKPGELVVGYAVMPVLPADVDRVSVMLGYGAQVADVEVGEGALPSEGAADSTTTLVGRGWPALPEESRIAAVPQPDSFIKDLVRRVADTERTVTQKEQRGKVEVDLSADVLFAVDQAALSSAARAKLAEVAADIAKRGRGVVSVAGYTDSDGSDSHNLDLSRRRAEAVLAALRSGVSKPGVTFTAAGKGEADPVADNSTADGKRLNRRVSVGYQVEGAS